MNEQQALKIRLARLGDAAVVTGFSIACAKESEGLSLDPARVRAGVETAIEDEARGRYYLAEDRAGPAGQIMITREWSDWRNAWIWWLQSVYVRANVRRQGVFRALLQHIEAEAHSAHAALLRLYVDMDNDAAEHAYSAHGFAPARYSMLEKHPPAT